MENFKETALEIAGIVTELMLKGIDVTMEFSKTYDNQPRIVIYKWGNAETYKVVNGVKGEVESIRVIEKSYFVDSEKEILPCIEYLQSLKVGV